MMGMMLNNHFSSIEQVTGTYLKKQEAVKKPSSQTEASFEQVFKERALQAGEPLRFSKHAGNRLEQRKISLSEEQLTRLNQAARRAEKKGIRESLMLMDGMAFIVNVRNNTVITAMEQNEDSENVFTNIDGAVIV